MSELRIHYCSTQGIRIRTKPAWSSAVARSVPDLAPSRLVVPRATRQISVLGDRIISHNQSAETSALPPRPMHQARKTACSYTSRSHISGLTTHHYLPIFHSFFLFIYVHDLRCASFPQVGKCPPLFYIFLLLVIGGSLAVNVTILPKMWISAALVLRGV